MDLGEVLKPQGLLKSASVLLPTDLILLEIIKLFPRRDRTPKLFLPLPHCGAVGMASSGCAFWAWWRPGHTSFPGSVARLLPQPVCPAPYWPHCKKWPLCLSTHLTKRSRVSVTASMPMIHMSPSHFAPAMPFPSLTPSDPFSLLSRLTYSEAP